MRGVTLRRLLVEQQSGAMDQPSPWTGEVGEVVLVELGHRSLRCRRRTVVFRREGEHYEILNCEACGSPLIELRETPAVLEVNARSGVGRWRERGADGQLVGIWHYVSLGEVRRNPGSGSG